MIKKVNNKKTYTITAALPYANGPIHIGHMAGVFLPADIYARYQRSKGSEVLFISGSDEGGAAITLQALKAGIQPKELVDTYHVLNKQTLNSFGISFDIFDRTTDPTHHRCSQDFFIELQKKGALGEKETKQYYDIKSKIFLADRYIKGTCPHCSFKEAYGDQCESCGKDLSPSELLSPKSVIGGGKLEKRTTKQWYLSLDLYQEWLEKWILEKKNIWKPNVYGQCQSWLKMGLKPRAITRDIDWGVPVPIKNTKGKVLYVWFEAPIGYISATKNWAASKGVSWEKYWKRKETKLIHFIGKDNIVFHCVIFPIMLKAHGEFILPSEVPANEFMNLEGKKTSTSKNHAIWLKDYLKNYPNKEDVMRYVLCSLTPESKDSDFTWDAFRDKNNNELVAIVGNFINRTLTLTQRYYNGNIPKLTKSIKGSDYKLIEQIINCSKEIENAIEAFKFRKALASWLELSRIGNKYLAEEEPWNSKRNSEERRANILRLTLHLVIEVCEKAFPFIPFTSEKIYKLLRVPLGTRNNWSEIKNFLHTLSCQIEAKKSPNLTKRKDIEKIDGIDLEEGENQKTNINNLKKWYNLGKDPTLSSSDERYEQEPLPKPYLLFEKL